MRKAGFTLTEAIMVMVILAIIVVASVPFITTVLDAWVFSRAERDVVFSGRLAINRMAREIRQAKSINQYNATAFNFTNMTDSQIKFYRSGNSLYRNNNTLIADMLEPSNGLSFTYFDGSGNLTTDDIRMVRIRLNLVSGENNMVIESLARFRNIQ